MTFAGFCAMSIAIAMITLDARQAVACGNPQMASKAGSMGHFFRLSGVLRFVRPLLRIENGIESRPDEDLLLRHEVLKCLGSLIRFILALPRSPVCSQQRPNGGRSKRASCGLTQRSNTLLISWRLGDPKTSVSYRAGS
jgi:hypothetical protein